MDEPQKVNLKLIADELGLTVEQVETTVALLDEDNTVPFITRYRKERTGNLNEEQIRAIQQRVRSLRQIAARAQTILRLIHAQGQLTDELRQEIAQAQSLKRLDDLYLPFRPKRQSRATLARERGLEPLATRVWNGDGSLADLAVGAEPFVAPEKELPTIDAVLQGVADILIDRIGDEPNLRDAIRKLVWRSGKLSVSQGKASPEKVREFDNYLNYAESVRDMPPHRILAINRGERLDALKVKLVWEEPEGIATIERYFGFGAHRFLDFLRRCASEALQRSISPALEREVRRELTEHAEAHAISVFARNLRHLLLQAPLTGCRVLAIDPGFRTGCKIAVMDECGHLLTTDVIYVTGSAEKKAASVQKLADRLRQHNCSLVAIGNGTACRETEELVATMIESQCPEARYVIVNEAGASIYSTSAVAREEFPDADSTERGTISIGRRLQDPLSELVKIEPQHIGVGMYQHDLTPRRLRESLNDVIESCVNYVGVDLNTASASLLRNVSGFNQLIARRVVEWRKQHGRFKQRRELLSVAGIGEATFTQAAGFLKITGGDEPLDGTWIHPESYDAAHKLLHRLNFPLQEWNHGNAAAEALRPRLVEIDKPALALELQIGLPTLNDIIDAILRPGRDPRQDISGPIFKKEILKLEDLTPGMELTGTVLNVVDFGAFVDIGLKDRGLVHISELSPRFVRSPHDVIAVGDIVTVWVLGVDPERRRVSLTLIKPGTPRVSAKPAVTPATKDESASPPTHEPKPPRQQPSERPKQTRPQRTASTRRRTKSEPPGPKLPDEVLQGRQPLRGFDELKRFWQQRSK